MERRGASNSSNLPDDPALLKEIIARQNELLAEQTAQIEKLRHEIELLKRLHFGPRSERIVPEQMLMAFATGSFPAHLPPPTPPRQRNRDPQHFDAAQALEGSGHGRQKLPDHLKRVEVVHDVPEGKKRCAKCRKALVKIGEDASEQLEYTPGHCHVIRNIRPKYVCPDECEEGGVVIAPPPEGPIEKGLPGPGMLSYVCVASSTIICRPTASRRSSRARASTSPARRSAAGSRRRRSSSCHWSWR